MITLERRGYTDTVRANIDNLYIEYHHLTGALKVEEYYDIVKTYNNKQYTETHSKVLYYGHTQHKGDNPINAISEIENIIKEHANMEVKFNKYVLAYDSRSNFYNKIYSYLNLDKQPEEIEINL